jgi:hypothetical protein
MIEIEDLKRGQVYDFQVAYYIGPHLVQREFRAIFKGIGEYGTVDVKINPITAPNLCLPRPWITSIESAKNKPTYLPRMIVT